MPMMSLFIRIRACLLVCGLATLPRAAESAEGRFGSGLAGHGIEVTGTYKVGGWRNLSGGLGQGNRALDNLDVMFELDGEGALGWRGLTGFVHLLHNNGRGPNELAGTAGGIDNIEVEERSLKVYQAWVQQAFAGGAASVLFGLHDLNSEFYVTESAGLFLNPTYGIGTEMSATGLNGPSIFPTTSLALRLRVESEAGGYLLAGVYDGVPGDPDRPRGTRIQLDRSDGALLVLEGGMVQPESRHFGIGLWMYTERLPDLETGLPVRSQGLYLLAEETVSYSDSRRITAFARGGFSAGDAEVFGHSWSVGMVAEGFVPFRPGAVLGLGVSRAGFSHAMRALDPSLDSGELEMELTVRDELRPGISVQPDLQWTPNPGGDPNLEGAWTLGVRLEVEL
jgi:porin